MEPWRKRLIALHHCPYLNDSSLLLLLKRDPELDKIDKYTPSQLSTILKAPINKTSNILSFMKNLQLENLLSKYNENHIRIISLFDESYPKLLKEIYDPPLILYTKGDYKLLQSRMLGVVGTREVTEYGQKSLSMIIPQLVKEGFTTVSGLARGVDTLAHKNTIENKGKTIAVLGSGILQIYPKENQFLANTISSDHLLLSEYPPFTAPKKWHFPKRNRIISGLSEGVVIIEAKEKSGSLITADQAIEQGREVFAVPGSILCSSSRGTNSLIQQGAKLVTSVADIIEELR
ncbi:DNA-processing protein DprA [Sutcliffiella deserti]|uniref:DNA-processing protein DprA n=1 Tax=Sutcliffiella deserti TaxID=2875501 RepID=UPI001CBAA240|nr:DNA-processing protein DprA [Sutcliffiella deserti]